MLGSHRYGRRSWALWGKQIHWADCKDALASIGRVAQDVTDRLNAEFHTDDLYMAYQAFDLESWAAGRASTPAMEQAAQKLCRALGEAHDRDLWQSAAQKAHRHLVRLSAARASSPDDNRLAWRAALGDTDFPQSVATVVRIYLATWDCTGAVERGLGQDAAIQKQHVGSRARSDASSDLYSGLLELKVEGPPTEQAMFTSRDGVLLLTDFSRACAQHWLLKHGRRFANNKTRKDQGVKLARRVPGTERAVQLRARAAYKEQISMAAQDAAAGPQAAARRTIFGVDRRKLMATVSRLSAPEPGRKTKYFRNLTAQKLEAKARVATWDGWTGQRSQARLGGSAAIEASTRTGAMQAVRARMWMSRARSRASAGSASASTPGSAGASTLGSASARASAPGSAKRPRQTVVDGTNPSRGSWLRVTRSRLAPPSLGTIGASSSARASTPSKPPTSAVSKGSSSSDLGSQLRQDAAPSKWMASKFAKARRSEIQIEHSLDSMFHKRVTDPDTNSLLAWLRVVSAGGSVQCEQKNIILKSSVAVPMFIRMSPAFEAKHAPIAKALRSVATGKKCKWSLDLPTKAGAVQHSIDRKRDLIDFLLQARRLDREPPCVSAAVGAAF